MEDWLLCACPHNIFAKTRAADRAQRKSMHPSRLFMCTCVCMCLAQEQTFFHSVQHVQQPRNDARDLHRLFARAVFSSSIKGEQKTYGAYSAIVCLPASNNKKLPICLQRWISHERERTKPCDGPSWLLASNKNSNGMSSSDSRSTILASPCCKHDNKHTRPPPSGQLLPIQTRLLVRLQKQFPLSCLPSSSRIHSRAPS